MHPSRESHPLPSQIERRVSYADFILSILDSRHKIEEVLLERATVMDVSLRGYHCESFETPEILDRYIPPLTPITIDLSAIRTGDGRTTIEHVELYPEDSGPLSLRQDNERTIIQSGEETFVLSSGSIEVVLRQLLPYTVRDKATVSQILEFISASSPESNFSLGYTKAHNEHRHSISLSKIESFDDSIETIEVSKYAPHASGAQVGTRMHLTESINRRRQIKNPDQTEHELIIEAFHKHKDSDELTVDTILSTNGRTVVVDTATRRHINDITEVLNLLK